MLNDELHKEMGPEERREWELFNLLEGELSAEDEKILMKDLDSDPEYMLAWEEIQQAVLPNEKIIYKNKESLLREEENKIIVLAWWKRPMNVAASIAAFLLISVFVYRYTSNPEVPVVADVETSIKESINNPSRVANDSKEETESSLELTPPMKSSQSSTASRYSKVESHVEMNNYAGKEDSQEIFEGNPIGNKKGELNSDRVPSSAPSIVANINIPELAPTQNQFTNISWPEKNNPQKRNPLALSSLVNSGNDDEYHGLRETLEQGLAAIVKPIQNTRVRINKIRDKKDPGLKIEVTTDQYYAIAMVHLLPRKKQQQ